MSVTNQCQKCNKLLWDCKCKSDSKCVQISTEQYYKDLSEDFTRTDIDRHIPIALPPKQPTILELIADIADLVERTPNDSELGAKVRKLFT